MFVRIISRVCSGELSRKTPVPPKPALLISTSTGISHAAAKIARAAPSAARSTAAIRVSTRARSFNSSATTLNRAAFRATRKVL